MKILLESIYYLFFGSALFLADLWILKRLINIMEYLKLYNPYDLMFIGFVLFVFILFLGFSYVLLKMSLEMNKELNEEKND